MSDVVPPRSQDVICIVSREFAVQDLLLEITASREPDPGQESGTEEPEVEEKAKEKPSKNESTKKKVGEAIQWSRQPDHKSPSSSHTNYNEQSDRRGAAVTPRNQQATTSVATEPRIYRSILPAERFVRLRPRPVSPGTWEFLPMRLDKLMREKSRNVLTFIMMKQSSNRQYR